MFSEEHCDIEDWEKPKPTTRWERILYNLMRAAVMGTAVGMVALVVVLIANYCVKDALKREKKHVAQLSQKVPKQICIRKLFWGGGYHRHFYRVWTKQNGVFEIWPPDGLGKESKRAADRLFGKLREGYKYSIKTYQVKHQPWPNLSDAHEIGPCYSR